jgi:hypothetical protein
VKRAREAVELEWPDDGDHPGVEADEVDDRAEDVGERDVPAPAAGRRRDPRHLLSLHRGCDGRVPEQAFGDAVAADDPLDPVSEQPAADRQRPEAGPQA